MFHGNPKVCKTALQIALARLVGYRWPAESDTEMELDLKARELIQEIHAFDHLSDADDIGCIPSVNGEAAGADRLVRVYPNGVGEQYDINTLTQLLEQEGSCFQELGKLASGMSFVQHCNVFNNRPLSGISGTVERTGFSASVNYHKLTKNNLSKLIYTYLGD